MSNDLQRIEATNMCKMMAQSTYALQSEEALNNVTNSPVRKSAPKVIFYCMTLILDGNSEIGVVEGPRLFELFKAFL